MTGFTALVWREVREILRDPFTLAIAFAMPVVLVFLFAYGVNLDVNHVATAVLDDDKSQESAEYIDRFTRTGYFDVVALPARFADAESLLRRDRVKAVVVIPPGFSRDVLAGRPATAQLILDGSFPPTATVATSYALGVSEAYTMQTIAFDPTRRGTRVPRSIDVEERVLYNPDLRTQDFIVPGLLGVILLAFPPLLSSLAVVRERERGSLMQLQIARVKPLAFVLAKLLPYVAIGCGELIILLALGTRWFGVGFRGPWLAFIGVAVLYVTAASAIGLLVSTFTRSQVVAMLISLIGTLMPSMLFSGFLFPIFDMPAMIQGYTFAFPARYFIEIARSMWLKGMPLENTSVAAASLVIYTIVLIAAAVIRTRALVKVRG